VGVSGEAEPGSGAALSEKLKRTLNPYRTRAIATQEVIEELIKLAKEVEVAQQRRVDLGLTEDQAAFYDALAVNESAVRAMGDDKLKVIAAELITQVRESVTIDWQYREGARAKIRVIVKPILNRYGCWSRRSCCVRNASKAMSAASALGEKSATCATNAPKDPPTN
jgi:type I site-specific restriction-modification system R (restriction) subunit